MKNLMQTCEECEAIASELREAYADCWMSSETAWKAWTALYKMIGERADELISKARFPESEKIGCALHDKFTHEAHSGHKVALE